MAVRKRPSFWVFQMNVRTYGSLLCALALTGSANADVIRQAPGSDYLVVEAEDYVEIEGDEFTTFLEVGTDTNEETDFGSELLPPDSNVSGTALFDQLGDNTFVDLARYELEFAEPGIYTAYLRYSLYAMVAPDENYANEDSLYFPLELGEEPEQDGWFSLPNQGHNDTFEDPPYWEGNFHWAGPLNFASGEPIEFEVTNGDVGTVLDFAVATRERGTTLDTIVFHKEIDLFEEDLDELLGGPTGDPCDFDGSGTFDVADVDLLREEVKAGSNNAAFDVNGDGSVNADDIKFFVEDSTKLNSWVGDANLDGEFNSADFVAVFQAGQYEDGIVENSTWATGDWTGDGDFDSGDFVVAFQSGGFELGPRGAAAAVPEPNALFALLIGCCGIHRVRRRIRA